MFGKWLIVKKDFKSHVASYMYLKPSFVCIYYQISTRTVWIVQGETEISQVCHQTHQMDWYLFISQRQALITNQSLASQLEMVQVSTEDQGVQLHSRMEHQRILCHSQVQAAWVDIDKALFRITHLRQGTLKVQLKDLLLRDIQDLTWFPPQVSWKETQNKTKNSLLYLAEAFLKWNVKSTFFFNTVEPCLTTTLFLFYKTTSLLRPYSFKPNVKTIESFYYFEDPVNATTSLLRPGFYGPTVVTLTGFHCMWLCLNAGYEPLRLRSK